MNFTILINMQRDASCCKLNVFSKMTSYVEKAKERPIQLQYVELFIGS